MSTGMEDVYAKRAQQLPASTQFAIVTALPNITNGAFWGFTDYATATKHMEAFKSDKHITARKLSNACLVEVNPDYLTKAIAAVDASLITPKDISNMQNGMASAIASFEKFLMNKAEAGFEGLVGIYCVNDSTAISYKGTSYPAFRINALKALELCAKWGYVVQVGSDYILPQQAYTSGQKLFDSMYLSPTNTGVFIRIKSTFPADKVKALKQRVKAQQPVK